MATETTNLKLHKPATSEKYDVLKQNQNWDKLDTAYGTLNSKLTWRQIYSNNTYTNHAGSTLTLSESVSNAKLLLVVAYVNSIASANRILFTIPVNGSVPASYYCLSYGTYVHTIRIEASNTNFTVLSTSISDGIFINSISALG